MNNYQHHDKAQQLAEAHSAYELARRVVELESARGDPVGHVFPDDIKMLEVEECRVDCYSVAQGHPEYGETVPLYRRPPSAVPEGYALVPIKPTERMICDGGRAINANGGEGDILSVESDAVEAYRAMLAAAPAPAEPPQQAQREQTIPEGYALVEKSIVPELAVKTGASLLAHLQAQGHDYRTLALAVYTDMVLAANVGEYPEPPAPAAVPECPFPCGWQKLYTLSVEKAAYLARSIYPGDEVTEQQREAIVTQSRYLLEVCSMMASAAAPQPKEAGE